MDGWMDRQTMDKKWSQKLCWPLAVQLNNRSTQNGIAVHTACTAYCNNPVYQFIVAPLITMLVTFQKKPITKWYKSSSSLHFFKWCHLHLYMHRNLVKFIQMIDFFLRQTSFPQRFFCWMMNCCIQSGWHMNHQQWQDAEHSAANLHRGLRLYLQLFSSHHLL